MSALAGIAELVVVVVHYGFLAVVVLGGFLALRWPTVLPVHLGCVAWGVLSVAFGWECPLTHLQFWLRDLAGRPPMAAGFNDTYVFGVIVPDDDVAVQVVAALVVAVSWVRLVRAARARRRAPVDGTAEARG